MSSISNTHESMPPTTPPPFTQRIVIQQPGVLQRIFCWLGWAGFSICFLVVLAQVSMWSDYFDTTQGIQEKFHSGKKSGKDKVAVISVVGLIADGDGFVKRQIDRVRDDEDVKAVVLRVDSPGGTVTGSDYIYHHLTKLREEKGIPIVVSMGSMAASGGYYVSMAVGDREKCIYAEPTTTTGSIGVIIPHYDLSGLLAEYRVKNDSIASHPRKQMLSMTRAIPDENRQILQTLVDQLFSRFKSIVMEGRPELRNDGNVVVDAATGTDLATGEIFSAPQALEFGLIDEIGFIEDAIDRAIEIAGLNKQNVRVVRFERPPSLFNLTGIAAAAHPGLDLTALLELNSPKAYYLATSLPPLVRSGGVGGVDW